MNVFMAVSAPSCVCDAVVLFIQIHFTQYILPIYCNHVMLCSRDFIISQIKIVVVYFNWAF